MIIVDTILLKNRQLAIFTNFIKEVSNLKSVGYLAIWGYLNSGNYPPAFKLVNSTTNWSKLLAVIQVILNCGLNVQPRF